MNLVKLSELLKQERVTLLEETDKRHVLGRLCDLVHETVPGLDRDELVETLLAREGIMSTGIGLGIAVPHARLKSVDRPVLAVGISRGGISYDSLDDQPVHVVVLIVVPVGSQKQYLQILARVTLLLKNAKLRERLLEASSAEDVFGILSEY